MTGARRCPLPDGGRLAFEIDGPRDAAPLLLLRPLGGSMALWGELFRALAREFRTVAFDPRGVGDSSGAAVPTTTRAMAEDARALLLHLSIARSHVLGLSLGGMVATWLAAEHPARVDRLVLASTPARGLVVARTNVQRGLGLAAALFAPAADVQERLVRRILSHRFQRRHPWRAAHQAALARAIPGSRKALLLHAGAAAMHDGRRPLTKVRAPTLLLFGERDVLLDDAARREVAGLLPGAEVEVIAGCGHDLSLEKPLEAAARIARFLHGAARGR